MDITTIIIAVISGGGGGVLGWFLTARNTKVEADQDTISKIKGAHDSDLVQWSGRMQEYFDKIAELHDQMEDLQSEIVMLRELMIKHGIQPPPRKPRKTISK